MPAKYTISRCPPAERHKALRLLHAGLAEDQQTVLVQTLDAVSEQGEAVFSGLLIATDSCGLQGVVWIQLTPGKTAVVWPPSNTSPAATALMKSAALFLDEQRLALAQILASPDSPVGSDLLAAGGFHRLAELAYLSIDSRQFPTTKPASDLQFLGHASEQPDRLGNLLLNTYEGSLDCPKLNGVRKPAEVLEGYAAQGKFAPENWFLVRCNEQDIGALILAEHGEGETWELVYMGVTPAGRGRHFGRQIVEFALWQAHCGGAQRVVLAVDQANEHALKMYREAGFVPWDRRTVFARFGTQAC